MISLHGKATSLVDRLDPRFIALMDANEKLARKDSLLWGPQAAPEAATRLNWIGLPTESRHLLPELDALAAKFRHCGRVVLCGMGGSSLAPEVIAATYKRELFVLDSTDPHYIAQCLGGDLSTTVVVVSSKSGSTIETASQRSYCEFLFEQAKLNATDHMIIVTDPDSPLDQDARSRGFTVMNADPFVGGRFSALTAFGLVPAALLGIDVSVLLDSADDALKEFNSPHSPVVEAAYLLAYHAGQYLNFCDQSSALPGLSDWIEQLIAESTGKNHTGRLPVVIETLDPTVQDFTITFSGNGDLVVQADLGAQFIFWEWVTALLCFSLGVDPFNQPNVTEAKQATAALLTSWSGTMPALAPHATQGSVQIFAQYTTIKDALIHLIDSVSNDGYISITAYLDRIADFQIGQLRAELSHKSQRPVTFGWGPRFLHSTGQFHKGGQQNGTFLQVTASVKKDIAVPDAQFSFHTLIMAQALGDQEALRKRGFTVVHLHLTDREEGISEILAAARSIT